MSRALLRKELRELLPWAILGVAIGVSEGLDQLASQIDLLPLGATFVLLNDVGNLLFWVVAFAIGTGLATREHDDGTLAFLDGLPVSRSRVFLVKCGVTAALVLIAPLLRVLVLAGMHILSRGSLDQSLQAPLLLESFALQSLLVVNGLMLGAAFGLLRSLTWLALGIAAAALLLLEDVLPRSALLNPTALLDWQWSSTGLHVAAETVWVQLAITAGAALIAWQGFVSAGRLRLPDLTARPVAGALVTVATIGAGIGVLALLIPTAEDPEFADAGGGGFGQQQFAFPESPPAQTTTAHYRFSYPAYEAEAALALAEDADAIFVAVHELLGVPLGASIDVDASGSARNTHGTAFYERLQMTLDSEVAPVLAHETAHVVAGRVAGGRSAWLWDQAPVLNEGLASWVESRFREAPTRGDDRMFVLAALHARRLLTVEDLAVPGAFAAIHDENVKYSAGEALIAAVVRVYGEAALPRLLAAFADPRLPTNLGGMPLWQSTFQLAGMDVAQVVDELYRGIEAFGELHAERIAALPRPRVRLVRAGNAIGAVAVTEPPTRVALRFKPAPDSPTHLMRTFTAASGQPRWRQPQDIAGDRVCVQVGIPVGTETLFEPWTCLPIADAAPWTGGGRGGRGGRGFGEPPAGNPGQ